MEKSKNIMMKCCEGIEVNYGRHARRRFERLLENNSVDWELTDQEILAFKVRFEDELAVTVFTRLGK